jgi:predicted transcriptional regulator
MPELAIPKTLAKRIEARAARTGERPDDIVRTALEKELGFERWLERELDRAETEADRGGLVSGEPVMAEARALVRRHARQKKGCVYGGVKLASARSRTTPSSPFTTRASRS